MNMTESRLSIVRQIPTIQEQILRLRSSFMIEAAALAAVVLQAACGRDSTPPQDDTTPPTVTVQFPLTANVFDDNGDALVDIAVAWADAGGIDLQSVRLQQTTGGSAGPNLLDQWTVDRLDSTGFRARETSRRPLRGGASELLVTIADKAGNATTARIPLTLPYGAFLKTIVTPSGLSGRGVRATVCDDIVYMTDGRSLTMADAWSFEFIGTSTDPWPSRELYAALCVPGDSMMYVTPHLDRFHKLRRTWTAAPQLELYSDIIQSKANPNTLYAGQVNTARIAIFTRPTGQRTGFTPIPNSPEPDDFVYALAVLPNDRKLYTARYIDADMLVLDMSTGITTRLMPGGAGNLTLVSEILVSNDGQSVFVALAEGAIRGVADMDPQTDQVRRILPLASGASVAMALSPDGKRLFVTTRDRQIDVWSSHYLIDLPSWQVVSEFVRSRQPGEFRLDGAADFRSDNRVAFVPRNGNIDVYLNRE